MTKNLRFGLIFPQYILPLFQCPILMFLCFFFFGSQKSILLIHLPKLCFIDGYAHLDIGGFFTVENDTGCCWKELSSVISYGAIFIRCPLFSIIKCLSSAALVTYGAPIFFLWMFVPISTCLCNKYYTPFRENLQLLGNLSSRADHFE